jgi:cyclomaltodextrinase / maltogenic alpha-amylase / neopullulanase
MHCLARITLLCAWFPASLLSAEESVAQGKTVSVEASEFVPAWAKSAVWYQIFPERFRDGDPSNNPKMADILGADPPERPKAWKIHPWGSDWYELQPYERANGEPELWKHLLRRRYGGDLQGVIDKLDYLKDLGINAIYLNPIFASPSLHKYDQSSYHHVDPNFGPDPEGDRKLMATETPIDSSTWVWTKADELALKLIDEAHHKGMRIIFDGVFNHMGVNSFAFKDLAKNQERSPYKDWFTVKAFDNPATPANEFVYDGWFGNKSLPELREDSNGIVQGPKDYIFKATERWMNPKGEGVEHGIDGWRLDVAYCVAHPFWKDWRKHVRSINPEAYLTAELVLPPEKVKPYLQGDEFDGEMNYNFAFAAAEFFFNPEPTRISVSEFDQKLEELRNLYPPGVAYVVQNLFGSHDSNRIASHIVNRGIGNFRDWGNYFNISQAAQNSKYNVRKPRAEELQLQKLFAIMQMTYVGAPMIYYGDEVGMWGGNDPDSRKPMLWPDITYTDEAYKPDGTKRPPDKVQINHDLRDHYKKLIALRNRYPALRLGSFETLLFDDDKGLYVFERRHEDDVVWVALNNSGEPRDVILPARGHADFKNELSGPPPRQAAGKLYLTIPAKWGAVLVPEKVGSRIDSADTITTFKARRDSAIMKIKSLRTLAASVATAAALTASGYGQEPLAGNGNTGFGGPIGKGSLAVKDDGTTVTFELTRGTTGALNDAFVIYIDSKEGGSSTTETFDDKGDAGRIAISGFDGTNRAPLKFAAGFEADYAIALQPTYAELFALSKTGPHTWVETCNLTPKGDGAAAKWTFSCKRVSLGAGASPLKISTTYIDPKAAYRSNEAVGNSVSGTPGDDKNFGRGPVEATFVTLGSAK